MDSGSWIALMMLGGTGLMCLLVGFAHKVPTAPVTNGWRSVVENLQQEADDLRRENQRCKSEITDLRMEVEVIRDENSRLTRTCDYWRGRYLQEVKRGV